MRLCALQLRSQRAGNGNQYTSLRPCRNSLNASTFFPGKFPLSTLPPDYVMSAAVFSVCQIGRNERAPGVGGCRHLPEAHSIPIIVTSGEAFIDADILAQKRTARHVANGNYGVGVRHLFSLCTQPDFTTLKRFRLACEISPGISV